MLFGRREKEAGEDRDLAQWAMKSAESQGRSYQEEEDDLRTCWERDRDRIVHSTGFRRLMYKTQVFVNWEGDHFRTRLSHSLEVCQVARWVGSALGLNEPLCEALALAHDIGHPPFGHRGEWALDELMKGHGGFRHNAQVLRVVDKLERRSPDYPGLNLTRELRESLLKHERDEDWPAEFRRKPEQPCLEAQVVDLADSTAYNMHDLEDGLTAAMFSEDELAAEVRLWRGAREAVELRHPGFLHRTTDRKLRIKRIANELIKICINDLIEASAKRLEHQRPASSRAVRERKGRFIGHSQALRSEIGELQQFLLRALLPPRAPEGAHAARRAHPDGALRRLPRAARRDVSLVPRLGRRGRPRARRVRLPGGHDRPLRRERAPAPGDLTRSRVARSAP